MTALAKAIDHWDGAALKEGATHEGPKLVDHGDEWTWSPHQKEDAPKLQAALAAPENRSISRGRAGAGHGTARKAVVEEGNDRFLLKPYHEDPGAYLHGDEVPAERHWRPHMGWAEMTNQALYHAGGIGGLHQRVHVNEIEHGGVRTPVIAIQMAQDHKPLRNHVFFNRPPHLEDEAMRIATMDYLNGVWDRHTNNMMVGPGQHLLAIDHGVGFQYKPATDEWNGSARSINDHLNDHSLGYFLDTHTKREGAAQRALGWWREASPAIQRAFEGRLGLIRDLGERQRLRTEFSRRAAVLDRAAEAGDHQMFLNGSHEAG